MEDACFQVVIIKYLSGILDMLKRSNVRTLSYCSIIEQYLAIKKRTSPHGMGVLVLRISNVRKMYAMQLHSVSINL